MNLATLNLARAFCAIFFAAVIGGAAFADKHLQPLHQAAANGDVAEVKRLIDGGVYVNTKDKDGDTPLHAATAAGKADTIAALVKAEANVNAKNYNGLTPLHVAVATNQVSIALILFEAGALESLHIRDTNGFKPLDYAVGLHGANSKIANLIGDAMVLHGDGK